MANGESLHIGLNEVDANHYAGWSGPLNACEADAEDMESLARDLGYQTKVLLTKEATRGAILEAISAAAKRLKQGDIFLLSYSGHGGQLPDRNGDETENLDETWCLFDGQLVDDELRLQWDRFDAGVRILVLSDSCHSGSVVRVAVGAAPNEYHLATVEIGNDSSGTDGARYRVAPRDVIFRTYRRNRRMYDEIIKDIPATLPEPEATVRLISGCQDNQLSLDGTFNGLFTGTLLRVWNSGRFQGNYADFHRAIVRRMPGDQTPRHSLMGPTIEPFDTEKPFTIG